MFGTRLIKQCRLPARLAARQTLPSLARTMGSAAATPRAEIEKRVLDLLRGFDKVDATQLKATSHFTNDLKLDSLDTVEVLLAIEEEFSTSIPDNDADTMTTPADVISYLADHHV